VSNGQQLRGRSTSLINGAVLFSSFLPSHAKVFIALTTGILKMSIGGRPRVETTGPRSCAINSRARGVSAEGLA
jgi:hypothetical protein